MIEVLKGARAHAGVIARLDMAAKETPWSEADIQILLEKPSVSALLILSGGVPAGFVLAQCGADEAEILNISVAPAARRMGLGSQLIISLSQQLRDSGIRKLFLEVAADNRPARSLYRALGFEETGRRAGYYRRAGGAVDAVMMRLNLVERGPRTS